MKIKVVATIAIVAILIAGVLLSVTCTLNFQPSVEITNFSSTGSLAGSSDGFVNVWFTLNLNNTGAGEAKDLAVTFSANSTAENSQRLIYANSTPPYDHFAEFKIGEPCLLGDLTVGETKDFMFYWVVSVDSDASLLTASIKSNGVTLDQATLSIPPIHPTPNVKITNFICLGTWHGTRLGGAFDVFSLSYANLGNTDVEYLIVTLNTSKTNEIETDPTRKSSYNPDVSLDEYLNGKIYQLEKLKAGEERTVEKTYFMVGAYNYVEPFWLTATLKSNYDTILDQETIMIPISSSR
ncbi:MAG: hypothetical protein NWE93_06345 [Candidatus Bathyarchaeota archaeon]|nr:hypothetical protein [Candidatus Bathyarchaeota archaeon]